MSRFLFLLVTLLFAPPLRAPLATPDRFVKSKLPYHRRHKSEEHFELTQPLSFEQLIPACSRTVLIHDFGNTMGLPPVSVPYTPPSDCPAPWSHIVLELRASCKGEQYDRIAAVWLDGVEILRTSTAEPTDDGVFWKVRKEVTRYSSLLAQPRLSFTVMLENLVDHVFTGVYHVNVSLFFYKEHGVRIPSSGLEDQQKLHKSNFLGFESEQFVKNSLIVNELATDSLNWHQNSLNLYEQPADYIVPISDARGKGYWFRIESESDVQSRAVWIPPNTRRAVLEVYVSFHGDDEFWYTNPPDSYIIMNNLTTQRGNGAYREVFVTIDRSFAGSVVPLPVIFTGGINPLFWEPVVAIGAFNIPSYDFDLTPYLGLMLDDKVHLFGVGVTDSIPFWLVDANLHLWLDHNSTQVEAKAVSFNTPAASIQRRSVFRKLDGSFKIRARRNSRFLGWVHSSAGNVTTNFVQQYKIKNSIRFQSNGTYKLVQQSVKTKSEVRVLSGSGMSRTIVKRQYPLRIITATLRGTKKHTNLVVTNVSHGVVEKSSTRGLKSSLRNTQDSHGWMEVKDHSVLSGTANTFQTLSYRGAYGCYVRTVVSLNGKLYQDNSSFSCPSSF